MKNEYHNLCNSFTNCVSLVTRQPRDCTCRQTRRRLNYLSYLLSEKKMAITNHMLFDKQEADSMPLHHDCDRDRDWWVFFCRPWKRI